MTVDQAQSPLSPKAWMKRVLIAAAVYNLAWGAFAIFFPEAIFRWAGFDPMPIYPQLWQCIGMIVGVYGIGYWIAAYNPFTHWPIVLVGLLGKIFGPIGFAEAVRTGALPTKMGWTILTNDLIWWVPFGLILFAAAKFHQSKSTTHATTEDDSHSDPQNDPIAEIASQRGRTLSVLSGNQDTLVLFLRHAGCTFCREALSDLAEQRPAIESGGLQIAIVHMGDNANDELFKKYKLDDIDRFSDPTCRLYRAFDLGLGTPGQLFGPAVWARGLKAAIIDGHGFGGLVGNGFQMPGVFILRDSTVISTVRHKTAAERPDYKAFACTVSTETTESDLAGANV